MSPAIHLPSDLVESVKIGKIRLFVGSGPSCASGLDSWDALIDDMSTVIRAENHTFSAAELDVFLKKRNHLDIAELFKETVGNHAYYRFLRHRYRKNVPLSRAHHSIARLGINTIFTTNYDRLLEAAIHRQLGIYPAVITHARQLHYIGDDESRVIKLHGDIDDPGTIVLTRRDYAEYAAKHRELADVLRSSINGWTVLFIGFGLRDPNFERIYADARSFYDSTNRQAYALMTGTNDVERALWHRDELTILPLAHPSQLVTALNAIRLASK